MCGSSRRLKCKPGHPRTLLRWGRRGTVPPTRGRPPRSRRGGYATSPALLAEGATKGCPLQRCHSRATHGCQSTKALAWKGPAGFPLRKARSPALRRYTEARHPRTSCVSVPRVRLRFPPLLQHAQGHAHWRAQVPRASRTFWRPGLAVESTQEPMASASASGHAPTQARARDRTVPPVRAPGSPPPSCALLPAAAAASNLRRQDVAGG